MSPQMHTLKEGSFFCHARSHVAEKTKKAHRVTLLISLVHSRGNTCLPTPAPNRQRGVGCIGHGGMIATRWMEGKRGK